MSDRRNLAALETDPTGRSQPASLGGNSCRAQQRRVRTCWEALHDERGEPGGAKW